MESILNNPYIKKLLSLELPANDYAIFASGPVFAHGLKELGHDLDIVARREAWEKAKLLGEINVALSGDPVIHFFDAEIEIFNSWAPGEWDIDQLIDSAELIEGIKFVSLENVLKWKKIFGREKDMLHIQMIEEYLKNRNT